MFGSVLRDGAAVAPWEADLSKQSTEHAFENQSELSTHAEKHAKICHRVENMRNITAAIYVSRNT